MCSSSPCPSRPARQYANLKSKLSLFSSLIIKVWKSLVCSIVISIPKAEEQASFNNFNLASIESSSISIITPILRDVDALKISDLISLSLIIKAFGDNPPRSTQSKLSEMVSISAFDVQ